MVKGQKYHILYKTVCTVTGNFYIGVHSTTDLEDGYLGSGIRLSNSVTKHGREKHTREILEFFESREELMKREKEVVNDELLNEEKCMNLKPGGEGGFRDSTHQIKCSFAGNKGLQKKMIEDISFRKEMSNKFSERLKKTHKEKKIPYGNWKGRKHTEESKRKIGETNSLKQSGSKNSQYGTCWINKSSENKKINKERLQKYVSEGWNPGRKMI